MRKKKLRILIENALIILLIVGIASYVGMYFRGMHNVDLVKNYEDIVVGVNEINAGWGGNQSISVTPFGEATDIANDFIERPLDIYYGHGLNQMETGLWGVLGCSLILGALLGRRL